MKGHDGAGPHRLSEPHYSWPQTAVASTSQPQTAVAPSSQPQTVMAQRL